MNQIQATKRINDYALETGDLSWHDQVRPSLIPPLSRQDPG